MAMAPRPMEVVLAGTGGCTAYDVVLILRKSRQDVRGCDVALKAERAESLHQDSLSLHCAWARPETQSG